MLIQWYPGHMTKARRMLAENMKLIDAVVEIVDARAPMATRNPDFDDLFANKRRIVILNKSDLASAAESRRWIEYYRSNGIAALEFNSTSTAKKKAAIELMENAAAEKVDRSLQRGVTKTVRVMVVGIPNVGKSTFINCIAGASRAAVADRPGVTRAKQWVKITPYLDLMDTPGLLWPKLDDQTLARHVAFIGSINDDILDIEELSGGLLLDLMRICPNELIARYKKLTAEITAPEELLEGVAKSRGFVVSGGTYDIERAARVFLDEFRAGKIARVTLERAPKAAHGEA